MRKPLTMTLLLAGAVHASAQSPQPISVSVSATTRTPIVLTTSVPGSSPVVTTTPSQTTTTTSLNSVAFSLPVQGTFARIAHEMTLNANASEVSVVSTQTVLCSSRSVTGATASSAPSDELITITPTPVMDGILQLRLTTSNRGSAVQTVDVDVFDDGSVDFSSTTTPNGSITVPLPRFMTTPLQIAVRRTSQLTLTAPPIETGEVVLTIDLLPRGAAQNAPGCDDTTNLKTIGRLDGGFDLTFVDWNPLLSAGRTDILLIGRPLASPIALPFAPMSSPRPCTLAVQPVVNVNLNGTRSSFTPLSIPRGVPLALRPLTLSAQVITLRSGLSTGGQSLLSTSPVALSFQ